MVVCVLGCGACSAPEEHTDLRPSGPPEVLTVLASNDPAGSGALESPTFCKVNDNKRPGFVPADLAGPTQVCPDDLNTGVPEVTDTQPVGWYVRIQFDELLNPDAVEELVPVVQNGKETGLFSGSLAHTQPVQLSCNGVPVPYDGYYNPSGNAFTWPLGPSLFIKPLDTTTIATGTECEVSLTPDVVIDKSGEHVPATQFGPYKFQIAELKLLDEQPEPLTDTGMPIVMSPKQPVILTFNATVDVASLAASEVQISTVANCATDPATGAIRTAKVGVHQTDLTDPDSIDPQSIEISDSLAPVGQAWLSGMTYIVTFAPGADVKDLAGGVGPVLGDDDKPVVLCFQTDT